jgi:hypothetical protein
LHTACGCARCHDARIAERGYRVSVESGLADDRQRDVETYLEHQRRMREESH